VRNRRTRARTPSVSSAVRGSSRLHTTGVARPTRASIAGRKPRKRRASRTR
jgi:hypothetical protein